jgi:PAS domain S-box-containing protein
MKIVKDFSQILSHLESQSINAVLSMIAVLISLGAAALIYMLPNFESFWKDFSVLFGVILLIAFILLLPARYVIQMLARMQSDLEESQHELNEIMDNSVGMLFIVSQAGQILDVNTNALQVLGYEKPELMHSHFGLIDAGNYFDDHFSRFEQMQKDDVFSVDSRLKKNNDELMAAEIRAYKVVWQQQDSLLLVVTDISQRKESEANFLRSHREVHVEKSELERRVQERTKALAQEVRVRVQAEKKTTYLLEYMQRLMDSMPTIIFTLDFQYQIIHWNQAALSIFEVDVNQIKSSDLMYSLPKFAEIIRRMTLGNDNEQVLRHRIVQDMVAHNFEIRVSPMITEEKPGWVVRIDEITKKMQMEDMIVQSEKMMSLGGLAAGMAHEINNPLGAILQSIQNIKRRLDPVHERNQAIANKHDLDINKLVAYIEEQRVNRFLNGIQQSGQRAAHIVSDMLSFARPSKAVTEPIILYDALMSSIRLAASNYDHKRSFDFHNIEVLCTEPSKQTKVMAQKNQIEQVFLNLITNAAQAFALSSNMARAPKIRLLIEEVDESIRIQVEDNGPGMPESVRKRVFEPFFTTKPEGVGTGLGLSVSFFIISEQMQGSLEVDSIEGEGTVFTIVLPKFNSKQLKGNQIELPI